MKRNGPGIGHTVMRPTPFDNDIPIDVVHGLEQNAVAIQSKLGAAICQDIRHPRLHAIDIATLVGRIVPVETNSFAQAVDSVNAFTNP